MTKHIDYAQKCFGNYDGFNFFCVNRCQARNECRSKLQ